MLAFTVLLTLVAQLPPSPADVSIGSSIAHLPAQSPGPPDGHFYADQAHSCRLPFETWRASRTVRYLPPRHAGTAGRCHHSSVSRNSGAARRCEYRGLYCSLAIAIGGTLRRLRRRAQFLHPCAALLSDRLEVHAPAGFAELLPALLTDLDIELMPALGSSLLPTEASCFGH